MKEIINLAGIYLIAAIDDGYYDSNGCFYKKLTNSQRNVLSKKYIFDIKKEKDSMSLRAYRIFIDEDESSITFNKELVISYIYKEKSIQNIEKIEEITLIYKDSLNPEVFISFVTLIMADKPCYEKFMEWTVFTISDVHEGIKEELYILLFNLIEKNQDGIISELLSKNMMAILYDFLYFNKKSKALHMNEYHSLLKVAENFENITLCNMRINYVQGEVCETIYSLIMAYGNENADLISKFIRTMIMMGEQSRSDKKYYKCILEILWELSMLKTHLPVLNLYTNINYILKRMFKYYEDRLDPEGFLSLLKMWRDYLIMKEDEEDIYPSNLKIAHDEATKEFYNRNEDFSLDVYCNFKNAIKCYEDLEYENNGYKIRIPRDPCEMKKVGKKLNICVGAYASSVAKKTTKILWLCNRNDIPIAALEVKENQLVQAKMANNHHPNYEVEQIIKSWCKKKELIIASF